MHVGGFVVEMQLAQEAGRDAEQFGRLACGKQAQFLARVGREDLLHMAFDRRRERFRILADPCIDVE
jgi:hypothetical protein